MNGRQEVSYKIMRQPNKQGKDTAHLHIIDKNTRTEYYRQLFMSRKELYHYFSIRSVRNMIHIKG